MLEANIYQSFILRYWHEGESWRVRLEGIGQNNETHYFSNPKSLVDFLQQRKEQIQEGKRSQY